jgi:hypothetical protein
VPGGDGADHRRALAGAERVAGDRRRVGMALPRRRPLGSVRDQCQDRHGRDAPEQAIEQAAAGRIDPVRVLDQEQQPRAGGLGDQEVLEQTDRLLHALRRRHLDRGQGLVARQLEQLGDQDARGLVGPAQTGQQRRDPLRLSCRAVLAREATHLGRSIWANG